MLRTAVAAFLVWLAMFVSEGRAFTADVALPDPALEKRAHEIARTLRCLVCQNQSIEDSNAPLARDLRIIVRERLAAGDTDDEVRKFIVDRYGDWVLLKPPFKGYTYALWFGPVALFLLAGIGAIVYFRGGRESAVPPLTEDEAARLRDLLDQASER